MTVRKRNVGGNNSATESAYIKRVESVWPLAGTRYTKYFLTPERELTMAIRKVTRETKLTYSALGSIDDFQGVAFQTSPFEEEAEITGHIVALLNVSMTPDYLDDAETDKDIDLFLTLRYIDSSGQEVFTGTVGDEVPLTKCWLRWSMRKVHDEHPRQRSFLPHREYISTDVELMKPGQVYTVDVEIWPTNVVVKVGGKIVCELASDDTQGCGIFQHNSEIDRSREKLQDIIIYILEANGRAISCFQL
jgi:predicted acyl esterase